MSPPTHEDRIRARKRPNQTVVMKQVWANLLFLHWEIDANLVQATLPTGLYVDTFKSKAFLGIVPFFMQRVRPTHAPPVPGISWFQELNLRTYVFDNEGRPGVWFYTLDCNNWLAVKLAQSLFHLPYNHAKMSSKKEGEMIFYSSTRRDDTVDQTFCYPHHTTFPKEASAGSLEFFLLERYYLFCANKNGEIYRGRVSHTPYQFEETETPKYSSQLFTLCGFDSPESKPFSSIIADSVSVDIFPLSKN